MDKQTKTILFVLAGVVALVLIRKKMQDKAKDSGVDVPVDEGDTTVEIVDDQGSNGSVGPSEGYEPPDQRPEPFTPDQRPEPRPEKPEKSGFSSFSHSSSQIKSML
tara:strand:+ start:115 stop:432 length:318 start_codon:yes stop_codon:yes gene_type:complete